MRRGFTRRAALKLIGAGALAPISAPWSVARAAGETETYGLSAFGDLAMAADFKHFAYVNPDAPKGGLLSLQITATGGNQTFETFDTLNMFSKKGDGAAGMTACYDSLMSGGGDEPDSVYGLLAKSVRIAADNLTYRFMLRPEAHFADGTPVSAADVAFSLTTLKQKAHYTYAALLEEMESASAESAGELVVKFIADRSRDAHLIVAGMPVFSQAWWKGREFDAATLEAPLGSGAYVVKSFEQGRFIEFALDAKYWAKDLPVNVGMNNFARLRYEYYRERQVAFEAFKTGAINYHEEYTTRIWATGYDFAAVKEGRIKKEVLHNGAPTGSQGWIFNTRREQFKDPRIREALGLCFDFDWTNKNIMYGAMTRVSSYFQNSDMEAKGKPGPDELALLDKWRGKIPAAVFDDDAFLPANADGSGSDRVLLKKADEMLRAAGCKREGSTLHLPSGKPFVIEFLDSTEVLQPHTTPLQQNLRKLGIDANSRIVDPAQYKSRTDAYDFDIVTVALSGAATPGSDLRVVYSSKAAAAPSSRNLAGISDSAVDAMIEIIATARSRSELNTAARALDRILRAGHYWIPMWGRAEAWIAHWDAFSRPERQPRLGTGAPDTWWWDEAKAKKIGL